MHIPTPPPPFPTISKIPPPLVQADAQAKQARRIFDECKALREKMKELDASKDRYEGGNVTRVMEYVQEILLTCLLSALSTPLCTSFSTSSSPPPSLSVITARRVSRKQKSIRRYVDTTFVNIHYLSIFFYIFPYTSIRLCHLSVRRVSGTPLQKRRFDRGASISPRPRSSSKQSRRSRWSDCWKHSRKRRKKQRGMDGV